jgi:hypothetical protein
METTTCNRGNSDRPEPVKLKLGKPGTRQSIAPVISPISSGWKNAKVALGYTIPSQVSYRHHPS